MLFILGSLVAGWFLADLGGGLFHWFIDHVAWSVWPIAGIVRDFREHHDDRLSMEKYSRVPSLILGLVGALPVVSLAYLAGLYWLAGSLFVGAALTQHAHHYAHTPRPPVWARVLQQLGVFMSPDAHERHHGDFYRSYGVLNGWSHGTLDLILGRSYS
jgi:plasmanylethanolamine desaturase